MGVARAFRESRELEAGLPVAVVAFVGCLCVIVDAPPLAIGAEMQRPGDFLPDSALLAVLAAPVVAWTVVRVRRGLDGASELERYHDATLRFLIAFHRIGGLVAFGLGLAWVVRDCAVQPRSGYGRYSAPSISGEGGGGGPKSTSRRPAFTTAFGAATTNFHGTVGAATTPSRSRSRAHRSSSATSFVERFPSTKRTRGGRRTARSSAPRPYGAGVVAAPSTRTGRCAPRLRARRSSPSGRRRR